MRIDKGISEKERYQKLRAVGYSATEARKYRRYGGQKFLEKIEEKSQKEYYKTIKDLLSVEKKTKEKILPDKKIPAESEASFNYKFKYNYIVKCVTNKGTIYITYTTNTKLKKEEVKTEIESYIKTANLQYRQKIIYWELKAIEKTA